MSHRLNIFVIYSLFTLITLLSYSTTLTNDFVYDDASVVSANPRIHTWKNIRYLFTHKYFAIVDIGKETAFGEASYRPVTTFTYFIDAWLWNTRSFGYHLTNLLLHFCCVILLFYLIGWLTISQKTALFGTVFFTIHPVLTEAVNGIGFREDILVVLFLLLGLFCLKLQLSSSSAIRRIFWDILNGILFLLALFSKEMAIMYPVLIGLVCINSAISFVKQIRLWAILIGCVTGYLYVRFFVMVNPYPSVYLYPGGTFLSNIYTMSTVVVLYIRLIFFPVNLLVDYVIKPQRSFLSVPVLFSLISIACIFVLTLYKFIKTRSLEWMGVLWFFIALIPVSNIIQIANIAAERYLYFSVLGISITAGIIFRRLFKYRSRTVLISYNSIILCFLIIVCLRNTDWQNSKTLWKSTIKVEPKSPRSYSNLASEFFEQHEYSLAIKYYLKCISLRNTAFDNYNLGNCYRKIGDFNRAVSVYRKAISIDPTYAEFYENLALSLIQLGKYDDAESAFRRTIGFGRIDDTLYENMGLLYDAQKKYNKALEYYQKALKLNPHRPSAINKIALVYIKLGASKKGVALLKKGIHTYPKYISFYKNLGIWYETQKDWNRALIYWEQTDKLVKDDPNIIIKIIYLCSKVGAKDKENFYKNKLRLLAK